jgi:hypothetical protein
VLQSIEKNGGYEEQAAKTLGPRDFRLTAAVFRVALRDLAARGQYLLKFQQNGGDLRSALSVPGYEIKDVDVDVQLFAVYPRHCIASHPQQ